MDFEFARENMVKQQVLTEGLSLDGVAKIMADIPREKFLPKEIQGLAYCDTPLVFGDRELRSPTLTARMIEALDVQPNSSVLKLGLECGYPAALLAKMAEKVELVDYGEDRLAIAKQQLAEIGINNVEFVHAESLHEKASSQQKYDRIYISTVLEEDELDESLLVFLDMNGKVVYVVRTCICDKVYSVTKTSKDGYEKTFLFDVYNK
ncbi:protein-L-isoaspartate O-methyltransferase [Candidatus Francisella endociliophora]|uniref:Protein-L-isoaspartate O-methyltransferase n=1 Tax=Candidatus Francisella endociliophora TaxID=653937 RepID=A0A097EPN6_9GAMM|nr:protein-L-isoaspartate O-methyltransferase [Francisella sp. FSC1006]AIT09530.1 protein-L-isoaspartate O-methyltransferase [Francisella sp. FSC1006]